MRNAVRVRMTKEQLIALSIGLLQMTDGEVQKIVGKFVESVSDEFENLAEAEELIDAARREYQKDEIEIDDDAALSHNDEGCWVSAWVFVSNEDTDP